MGEEFVLVLQSFPVRNSNKKSQPPARTVLVSPVLFFSFLLDCTEAERFCSGGRIESHLTHVLSQAELLFFFSTPLNDSNFLFQKKNCKKEFTLLVHAECRADKD